MLFTVSFVSIKRFLDAGVGPAFPFDRQSSVWYIRQTPLGEPSRTSEAEPANNSADWIISKQGQTMAIPLVPYALKGTDVRPAFMAGWSLGQRLLGAAVDRIFPDAIQGSQLVVGEPFEALEAGGVRIWLGFAVRIKA